MTLLKRKKKKRTRKKKKTIGWRELVDLPDWNIKGLRAKIDTGAKSSAIHVEHVKELPDGKIEFYVILNRSRASKKIVAKALHRKNVRSSIGIKTSRWYVQTRLRLGGIEKKITLNLIGREGMIYRMLLGRNALRGSFIVDVGRSYLCTPLAKRRKKRLRK